MEQYRHCKPILAIGTGASLLDDLGISHHNLSDKSASDAALISTENAALSAAVEQFIRALGKHRDYARETDPPEV
jgi:catalase